MQDIYMALCMEIFGTADVDELRKIADKSSRNAGRKALLSSEDICSIKDMLASGGTMEEAAAKYDTSRQVISKYVNCPPGDAYDLKISFMNGKSVSTVIYADTLHGNLEIENRTPDVSLRAFGEKLHPSWKEFTEFLRGRCEEGENILALTELISSLKKSHGRLPYDSFWLRFG